MNHCVPNFQEMEDDYSIPTPSGFSRPKKLATTGEEEIMELLWQNGQVVVQSQNQQRPPKRNALGGGDVVIPSEKDIRSGGQEQHHLFMQEDEMSSWLQYPLDDSSFDRDLYSDLLFPAPPPPNPINTVAQPRAVAEIRPPPPPITKPDNPPRLQNFMHFSRPPNKPSAETTNKPWATTGMESTVVESNETPAVAPESSFSHRVADSRLKVNVESGTEAAGGELGAGTCEVSVTSSPGGSRASFSASEGLQQRPQAASGERERKRKRKRKDREGDDSEYQSEDIEFEAAAEAKKQGRGSASTKRSRATEVHNLSERRRRDRINEKMRALQDLIPRCNKSDKASMLDEAIEYLKSLQVQVQMMSMGCGMVPMMYPGMQQYMPAMGMGMGMGIGMNVGMNRPMVPYPSMLPGSAMPSAAAAHMGSRFPMPAFQHMQQVPLPPDPTRIPASNQTDPNPITSHGQNQTQIPNFIDPYQQFIGLRRSQLPLPQNQAVNKPQSTGKDIGGNHNNQQS